MKANERIDSAIADFLAKGGVIQQAKFRESGRVEGSGSGSRWGAKKVATAPIGVKEVPIIDEDDSEENENA